MAEPPIVSECSVSGILAGSGLLLPVSPSHTTDGLNSLSKKMLGGGPHRVLCRCGRGYPPPDCFPEPHGEIRAPRTELTSLGRRYDRPPSSDPWHQSLHLFGILRGSSPHAPPCIKCPWKLPSGDRVTGPHIRLRYWSLYTVSAVRIELYLRLGTSGRCQPPVQPAFWSRRSA